MMHHPNMHHQPMSGHPPQHLGGHQVMPNHHQMPPHQIHREERHVPMHRMAMGPSQGNNMGSMPGMVRPHAPRPPMQSRPMQHHAPAPHHAPPNNIKPMRRNYMGNNYQTPNPVPAAGMMYPQQHHPISHPPPTQIPTGLTKEQTSPLFTEKTTLTPREFGVSAQMSVKPAEPEEPLPIEPRSIEPRPVEPRPALANSKEKTPMCLVNELARYNKVKHQYRLTSEMGPAHKKVFTVTLRLGELEEYTAEGSSIKRAQHAAASAALTQTSYTAPPPRAQPATDQPHHRHSAGAVMPTVELNALAMKLCEPVVYNTLPAAPTTNARARPARPTNTYMPFMQHYGQRAMSPNMIYRVRVSVGGRAWLGEGNTPQAARHDAAARALAELRPQDTDTPPDTPPDTLPVENGVEILNSEVKSPVSMVHELALKKDLTVVFGVKSERGPPHMRVFVTTCTVGELETEGEGNGKKVSKRRAAERMLDEIRRRWPPALLRARPPPAVKRKPQPTKKKSRNLIKENGEQVPENTEAADNPISRLAQARHAARARSPQYRVLEERGVARRREFLVQCDAPPHRATGVGPNKKTAKRRAAHSVLQSMDGTIPATTEASATNVDSNATNGDSKRKESQPPTNDENRQPVPGVLMMDYHQRLPQTNNTNSVSEESSEGNGITGAKDQLLYLAQLLGFTVQFSDFPKRNRGSYLSLVSLSTLPPVMCHGGGASTALSHEHCSRNALTALAKMGLDAPDPSASIPGAMTNGVSE